MLEQKFDHEVKPIKVGATFTEKIDAEKALNDILKKADIHFSQVEIISPEEKSEVMGKKLEPEQAEIGKNLLRSHYWFCVYGAGAGFVISLLLYSLNLPVIDSSAGILSLAFSSVGALMGLMIANIYAIKPHHDIFINQMHDARLNKKWSLVVHVKNKLQMKKTKRALTHHTNTIAVAI